MHCSSCGFENPEGMKFCGECGAPLTGRCPQCGFENPPQFKFCGDCGASLSIPSQALSSAPVLPPSREPLRYTPTYLAEKIVASRSALEGERKQVTVLFAPVNGAHKRGDHALYATRNTKAFARRTRNGRMFARGEARKRDAQHLRLAGRRRVEGHAGAHLPTL
jgi:Double zinc ribbon